MWHVMVVSIAVLGQPVDRDGKSVLHPEVMKWVDAWQSDKAERMAKLKKRGGAKYQIERIRAELPAAPGASFPLKEGMIGTFDDFSAVQFLEASVFDDAGFLGRVTIKVPAGREQYIVRFQGFSTDGLPRDGILTYAGYFVVRKFRDDRASVLMCEAIDLPAYCAEWARLNPDEEKPVVKAAPALKELSPEEIKERDEKLAAAKLRAAEALLKAGKADGYRKTLKELVEKYPDTEAAKKAKRLLK